MIIFKQHSLLSPYLFGQLAVLSFILITTINSSNAHENKAIEARADTKNVAISKTNPTPKSAAGTPAAKLATAPTFTSGDRCTGDPKFLESIGFSKRAVVDTTSTHRVGLMVTDMDAQGQRGRSTQHESWSQAGYLGRVQRDRNGNIYTYPAPSVTLVHNPIDKANVVYRVDSETGVMAAFAELPKEAPATEQNPFGLLALALDCEANALYAASVYGSTASSEKGIIARIDLASKEVKILKRGIDALSLLVAFDRRGKRLYIGTARDNTVVSYGFTKDGALAEDESVEITLDEVKSAQDKRPRVLRIDGRSRLYVRAIPFEYNLAARTTIPIAEMTFTRDERSKKLSLIEERSSEQRTSAPATTATAYRPATAERE